MTLLSVVQDVCAAVGVMRPTSVFSGLNTNRTMQEMLTCANEMAQTIAYDGREWTALQENVALAGDGVTDAFPLPANFKRFLLSAEVWRTSAPMIPMRFIPDLNEWLQRRLRNFVDAHGEWIRNGGKMTILPIMGVGDAAHFVYLDKNCISLASGGVGDSFMADGDSFILGDRLLKLGMIHKWKAQKGSPYAEDMANYASALAFVSGADKPAPTLIGSLPMSAYARGAYPYAL